MIQVPLFPLGAVLFPYGRMPLRIFEPRYLDLVRDSLKQQREFGVIWIREGREVILPGEDAMPKLAPVGCLARVVDWDATDNGQLAITIEGTCKFRLLATEQQSNFLIVGDAELLAPETVVPLPERAQGLIALLRQLIAHPLVARLNVEPETQDATRLANQIAQLLPLPETEKFILLTELDPLRLLDRLLLILDQITGE